MLLRAAKRNVSPSAMAPPPFSCGLMASRRLRRLHPDNYVVAIDLRSLEVTAHIDAGQQPDGSPGLAECKQFGAPTFGLAFFSFHEENFAQGASHLK